MTTRQRNAAGDVARSVRAGGRSRGGRPAALAVLTVLLCACSFQDEPDPAVMDGLAEMEVRMRLLQSEVSDLRRALAAREQGPDETARQAEAALQARFDTLEQRLAALPDALADRCPSPPPAAPVSAQCNPDIRRVIVSGDRLVVGEVERVWIDPPGSFLMARMDPTAEFSFIHADEVVEFERDGSRWVRFGITVGEETTSIERPLKRFVRARDERRPVVDLRVQLGDVRETLEFAPADLSGDEQPVILGRNFLTDVALLDVGKRHVQPAPHAPDGGS